MHLSVGDVMVIGVMAHQHTHSHVSQSIPALWILQFWQGVSARARDRGKKNEDVERNKVSYWSARGEKPITWEKIIYLNDECSSGRCTQ